MRLMHHALLASLVTAYCALTLFGCSRSEQASRNVQRPASPHAKHLVLLVLDTARADRMSLYGHELPTTPYLSELAGQSVVFERAKAPAPWTVPSHASLLTGLWPAQHQAQWGRFTLAASHLTLAEVLRDEGFHTVGLTANAFLAPENGFAQGFDHYEIFGGSLRTRSKRVVEQMAAHLEPARRNFVFLNVLDAHIPYNTAAHGAAFGVQRQGGPVNKPNIKWAISAGDSAFSDEDKQQHAAAYDAAIRALDDIVADVFARLETAGLLQDALVIITSDHGDGLGVHQIIGHSASTWEEQLAIPLMLWFPKGLAARRIEPARSTVDVPATAVDWLGVPRPQGWLEFPTLFDATSVDDRAPTSEEAATGSAVTADYRSYFSPGARGINAKVQSTHPQLAQKVQHTHILYCDQLKLSVRPTGAPLFFDLDLDPHEQSDLWDKALPSARSCFARYRRLLAGGRFTPFDDEATEEQRGAADAARNDDRLRALGYLQ